jgi:hypothetical protein
MRGLRKSIGHSEMQAILKPLQVKELLFFTALKGRAVFLKCEAYKIQTEFRIGANSATYSSFVLSIFQGP